MGLILEGDNCIHLAACNHKNGINNPLSAQIPNWQQARLTFDLIWHFLSKMADTTEQAPPVAAAEPQEAATDVEMTTIPTVAPVKNEAAEGDEAPKTEEAPTADIPAPPSAVAATEPMENGDPPTAPAAADNTTVSPAAEPRPASATQAGAQLPVRQYLEATVVPVLMQAMQKLVKDRPEDPIGYVADYLAENNPKRRKVA